MNHWDNVFDTLFIYSQTKFHIIFVFVLILNGIYMIFDCVDVVCYPHVNMQTRFVF